MENEQPGSSMRYASFANLIEPSPDPALAANPKTAEEFEAEAAFALAQAEVMRVRAEVIDSLKPKRRPNLRPAGFRVFREGQTDAEAVVGEYEQLPAIIRAGSPEILKVEAAELKAREAGAVLSKLEQERIERTRRWRLMDQLDHGDDPWQPTDKKFALAEGPRAATEPENPQRVADWAKVIEAEKRAMEIADQLRERPWDDDLKSALQEATDKARLARIKHAYHDSLRAAKQKARQIIASLAPQPAPAQAKKR